MTVRVTVLLSGQLSAGSTSASRGPESVGCPPLPALPSLGPASWEAPPVPPAFPAEPPVPPCEPPAPVDPPAELEPPPVPPDITPAAPVDVEELVPALPPPDPDARLASGSCSKSWMPRIDVHEASATLDARPNVKEMRRRFSLMIKTHLAAMRRPAMRRAPSAARRCWPWAPSPRALPRRRARRPRLQMPPSRPCRSTSHRILG